jgi:hypothetical protein
MKKIQTLRIAGLILCTSPIILKSQTISDLSKGLLLGAGIGLLFLSLLLQFKKPKTT